MNTFNLTYLQAIMEEMADDNADWRIVEIVDEPTGIRQDDYQFDCPFDHTFLNQRADACEDSYYGYQYFPVDGGKYLKVSYSM